MVSDAESKLIEIEPAAIICHVDWPKVQVQQLASDGGGGDVGGGLKQTMLILSAFNAKQRKIREWPYHTERYFVFREKRGMCILKTHLNSTITMTFDALTTANTMEHTS